MVGDPYLVIYLNLTLIFEWCAFVQLQEWVLKRHVLEEIGVQHAQNVITILGSIVNVIGDIYMTT